jgi:hypothetical protein
MKNNLHSPSGFPKTVVKHPRIGLQVVRKTTAAVPDNGTDLISFIPDGKLHPFIRVCSPPMNQGIVHRFVKSEKKEHAPPFTQIPENRKDPISVRGKLFNRTETDFYEEPARSHPHRSLRAAAAYRIFTSYHMALFIKKGPSRPLSVTFSFSSL